MTTKTWPCHPAKRAVEALERGERSALGKALAAGALTSRVLDELADEGDELAARLMRETARYLAVGAVTLMHAIDPDVVLFAGGMIASGGKLLDDIRALALPTCAEKTRIEYAALGGDAGFIGAAGCARLRIGSSDL